VLGQFALAFAVGVERGKLVERGTRPFDVSIFERPPHRF